MTEQEFNELRDIAWRRPLDAAEEARIQAYLALNPDRQQAWELESDLTDLLAQLPPAPLSSNFTSQVLAAVDRDLGSARAPAQAGMGWLAWRRLVPRLAWSVALLVFVLVGYQQHRAYRHHQLAQNLVRATYDHRLGAPSIFKDFEAIQRLGQVPQPADEELWLLLNQTSIQ